MPKKPRIPHKFHPWIDARKKFRLSDAHIQMARELGLSPKRFDSYADLKGKPWKLPLVDFIQSQYEKQFGKSRPETVLSMEEIAAAHVAKRAARKAENAKRLALQPEGQDDTDETVESQTNEPKTNRPEQA